MYVPFNESSIDDDFINTLSFQDRNSVISEFISIIKESREKKILNGIILTASTIIENAPFIVDWLNNPRIDRDDKTALRTLIGCFFFQSEEPLSEAKIIYNEKQYSSKGAALAIDTKCNNILNCPSNIFWKQTKNTFVCDTISEEGELISFTKELIQLFDLDSLNSVKIRNKLEAYATITSGQDLWEQWDNLFPNLIKCNNTKDCLYKNPEKYHIIKIIEQLDLLQEYFSKHQGLFTFDSVKQVGIEASDESITVKHDPELKKERLNTLPDGSQKYFFYHTKFWGKFETRLYFYPIQGTNKCYIGYIGKHLKTKRF